MTVSAQALRDSGAFVGSAAIALLIADVTLRLTVWEFEWTWVEWALSAVAITGFVLMIIGLREVATPRFNQSGGKRSKLYQAEQMTITNYKASKKPRATENGD